MDFTLKKFGELLDALKFAGYHSVMPDEINNASNDKFVVLRHDVDRLPFNSYMTAKLEEKIDFRGIYYFRMVPASLDKEIIMQIGELGHEVGYHYEDVVFAKGDVDRAWQLFLLNLERLRKYYPVKHCCMHGSPLSKYDNRSVWEKYDYRDAGVICEPYFDVDLTNTLYLTDTGRVWDGAGVSVRDKIMQPRDIENSDKYSSWKRVPVENSSLRMNAGSFSFQSGYSYRNTDDIISSVVDGSSPSKIMITFHPQRWTNSYLPWIYQLTSQSIKNIVKSLIVRSSSKAISL